MMRIKKKFKLFLIYVYFFIIFIVITLSSYYYDMYKYCLNCSQLEDNKHPECFKCPIEMIFKGLKIKSPKDTLNEIIKNNSSISRFGDGEFLLIFGVKIPFQIPNPKLKKRLKEILISNEKNLLIGILPYKIENMKKFKENEKNFILRFYGNHKYDLLKIINKNKIYYSTLFSRFYMPYKNNNNYAKIYIKNLKKIWNNKDVLIIEGEQSRLGIGNDLFNNMKSIKRIICPKTNSFNVYDKIINKAILFKKDILILIALGPTATILAYDLSKLGYQAIDIGHADIEYEWYLRKSKYHEKINYKYVNEAYNGRNNILNVTDLNYYNQIVYKILF